MNRLQLNTKHDLKQRQLAFDDLGLGLDEVTFVVVDLETTGSAPGAEEITEIGAVKSRGGQRIGEFATLVNPDKPIPPTITHLTGITTAMVIEAPRIARVLPAFLEFLGNSTDTVLVAHNARFDVGHLKAAAKHLDLPWPKVRVLDTVGLARRLITRDETPNYKLGTLARVVGAETTPNHRALEDARATEDLLQFLIGRMGSLGATHVTDLDSITDAVPAKRRQRSYLAQNLPHGPGVYRFIGPGNEVLYVGTSNNIYKRVRQYFTAAEKRKRIGDMVDLAQRVEATSCATQLEANILELRQIRLYDPPFNRRSKRPESKPYLTLSDEPFPRLTVTRKPSPGALGPFSSRSSANAAKALLERHTRIRTCTTKLSPRGSYSPCSRLDMGMCDGVCVTKVQQDAIPVVRNILNGVVQDVVTTTLDHLGLLAQREEFERAAEERDQLNALLVATHRAEKRDFFASIGEVALARKTGDDWSVTLIRYGQLVGTATCSADQVLATADFLSTMPSPEGIPSAEEMSLLYEWMCHPDTRLITDLSETCKVRRSSPLQFRIQSPK